MCSCGCNTCETKVRGPLLTEGKVKSLLSEGLKYHIDKKIPLFESIYRIGSDAHLSLIKEARKMYSRNIIDLCEEDEALIKTHLGEFGLFCEIEIGDKVKASKEYGGLKGKVVDIRGSFIVVKTKEGDEIYHESDLEVLNKEGVAVPLDLPMLNETQNSLLKQDKLSSSEYQKAKKLKGFNKNNYKWNSDEDLYIKSIDEAYSGFLRNPEDPDFEPFEPTGAVSQFKEELRALFGKFKGDLRNPEFIKGVAQIMVNWKSLLRSQLEEAEFKGKDVPLNKPKRGGSKAYYVYVRDPKTKRIKKVSFGSGGLRAKIKNKQARTAFAKRHRCSEKKDRTKASYWSCNLPKFASLLGLGANQNTYW